MRPPHPIYLSAENCSWCTYSFIHFGPNSSAFGRRRCLFEWISYVLRVTQCNHRDTDDQKGEKYHMFANDKDCVLQWNANYFIKCFCVRGIKCCFIHEQNAICSLFSGRHQYQNHKWQWLFWTFFQKWKIECSCFHLIELVPHAGWDGWWILLWRKCKDHFLLDNFHLISYMDAEKEKSQFLYRRP